jgi:hypothetical protein
MGESASPDSLTDGGWAAGSQRGSQRRNRLPCALTKDTRKNDEVDNKRRRKKRYFMLTLPAAAVFVKRRGTAPRLHNTRDGIP